MKRTLKQNKVLHTLLYRLGLQNMKQELVWSFSNGRTEHSSEMTQSECEALINYLHKQLKNQYKKEDRQRKKIIALFVKMGYTTKQGKADMKAINTWCKTHGYLHKELNRYTYKELPKLVIQAEKMYLKFLHNVR